MPKEDFSALSPEVRRIRSKIPPKMKSVILRSITGNFNCGANNHSKNVYKTVKLLLNLLGNLLQLTCMHFLIN